MSCYCGLPAKFEDCCEPRIGGTKPAETPEALMRSRYSAFCVKDLDYLIGTTDPQTRLDFDFEATREWAEGAQFTKLEILKSSAEGNKGVVEFKAFFRMGDKPEEIHHEISKFRKQAGTWYFREGRYIDAKPEAQS